MDLNPKVEMHVRRLMPSMPPLPRWERRGAEWPAADLYGAMETCASDLYGARETCASDLYRTVEGAGEGCRGDPRRAPWPLRAAPPPPSYCSPYRVSYGSLNLFPSGLARGVREGKTKKRNVS